MSTTSLDSSTSVSRNGNNDVTNMTATYSSQNWWLTDLWFVKWKKWRCRYFKGFISGVALVFNLHSNGVPMASTVRRNILSFTSIVLSELAFNLWSIYYLQYLHSFASYLSFFWDLLAFIFNCICVSLMLICVFTFFLCSICVQFVFYFLSIHIFLRVLFPFHLRFTHVVLTLHSTTTVRQFIMLVLLVFFWFQS